MGFMKFDLGKLQQGKVVEVTLSGSVTNVLLLDRSNMYNYERCRDYDYHGGIAKKSPVRFEIPRQDNWFIVVDREGIGTDEKSTASVKVL
ncbi:MAG: DUF1883 domain-containing protein [Treponema sp.]|jgi:hypothetical protein|nr:DUF1883 domain-containing protein [Treponema sp.]